MKKKSEADKLRRELVLFVDKMQQEGINIVAIKKPIDAVTSISCVKKI